MRLLKSHELEDSWGSLIYAPKQLGTASLDLTVKKIFRIDSPGTLDFGGSEYQPSGSQLIPPRIEDDPKYGWWTLTEGYYKIEYNEILSHEACLAIVFPHQRLQMTGCFHSSFIVQSSAESNPIQGSLIVETDGVRIKENARISTAITFLVK
ncbi:MAG: hypothetical protein ACFE95_05890 [Candidatus Hodarchaeota archaeon]